MNMKSLYCFLLLERSLINTLLPSSIINIRQRLAARIYTIYCYERARPLFVDLYSSGSPESWRHQAEVFSIPLKIEAGQKYTPSFIAPYIKNWDETRPAVIIILGPRPAKRPLKPASRARATSREDMLPVGPCPLLIWESRVSAGYKKTGTRRLHGYNTSERQRLPVIDGLTWLRMAAAKPAMMPLPRERLYFRVGDCNIFCLDSSVIDRKTSSWQYSFTVNWPMA